MCVVWSFLQAIQTMCGYRERTVSAKEVFYKILRSTHGGRLSFSFALKTRSPLKIIRWGNFSIFYECFMNSLYLASLVCMIILWRVIRFSFIFFFIFSFNISIFLSYTCVLMAVHLLANWKHIWIRVTERLEIAITYPTKVHYVW